MAASDKVFIAALLLMAMLSISYRGVSAQSCADSCVTIVTSDDERACKAGMNCIDALPDSKCGNDKKDEARKKLIEKGCSGSGIPIISAMSLFVAALFHML